MAYVDTYAVMRTDNLHGSWDGVDLVSVRYKDSNNKDAAIENGCVIKLAGLESGQREVYKGVTPAANTSLDEVVLICTPEMFYDERKHNLDKFINEAGTICRGFRFHKHDVFGLTAKGFVIANGANPDVGWVAELVAGNKMQLVSSATGATNTVVGKVEAIETAGLYTYYVIRI